MSNPGTRLSDTVFDLSPTARKRARRDMTSLVNAALTRLRRYSRLFCDDRTYSGVLESSSVLLQEPCEMDTHTSAGLYLFGIFMGCTGEDGNNPASEKVTRGHRIP
jgi:hypothetical protein